MRLFVKVNLSDSYLHLIRVGVPFIVNTTISGNVHSIRCTPYTDEDGLFAWVDALVPEALDKVQKGDVIPVHMGKEQLGYLVVQDIISEESWKLLKEGIESAKENPQGVHLDTFVQYSKD